MENKVPISLLHTQAFCEYQIYIEHVKRVETEPTPAMRLGRKIHRLLDNEHKKRADVELSVTDALEKSEEEKVTLISREVPVTSGFLYGVIDEIWLMPNQILVIDDKPNSYPFMTNKKQVWGYCLAFKEQFSPKRRLVACLRQRDTFRFVWREVFSQKHKGIVLNSVERILGIINGNRQPEPTGRARKCNSCRFKKDCEIYSVRFSNEQ